MLLILRRKNIMAEWKISNTEKFIQKSAYIFCCGVFIHGVDTFENVSIGKLVNRETMRYETLKNSVKKENLPSHTLPNSIPFRLCLVSRDLAVSK